MDIKLPSGGNNGFAIRYPGKGDTAYVGMCELQVLDNSSKKYAKLHPAQYHASAYGMVAARRGYQRPVGQWNHQKVTVKGHTIRVELNGYEILNGDLSKLDETKTNGKSGKFKGRLRTKGYFGFAGHGSDVAFKNVRIKKLD